MRENKVSWVGIFVHLKMARYLVREHYCWCDSCFCSCLHEAYDLKEKKLIQMKVGIEKDIIWSYGPSTAASYTEEKSEPWDLEKEAIRRDLVKSDPDHVK